MNWEHVFSGLIFILTVWWLYAAPIWADDYMLRYKYVRPRRKRYLAYALGITFVWLCSLFRLLLV